MPHQEKNYYFLFSSNTAQLPSFKEFHFRLIILIGQGLPLALPGSQYLGREKLAEFAEHDYAPDTMRSPSSFENGLK